MNRFILDLRDRAIVGTVIFAGIVAIAYAFTGQMPGQSVLIGASIGAALSPAFWSFVRAAGGQPASKTDDDQDPT